MEYPAPYRRKAHYYETDQMGIVHHSNYIRWMEESRVDFLDKVGFGYTRIENLGIAVAVIGVECEYKSMVRFEDEIEIVCRITACKGSRMAVGYRICDARSGELRAIGETRHAFLREDGRPVLLRKVAPELSALFEQYVQQEEKTAEK